MQIKLRVVCLLCLYLMLLPGAVHAQNEEGEDGNPLDSILEFIPGIVSGALDVLRNSRPPLPAGVAIYTSTLRIDNFGNLLVVGEVSNNTAATIDNIRIQLDVFNNKFKVFSEERMFLVAREIMPPRTVSCFSFETGYRGSYDRIKIRKPKFRITLEDAPKLRVFDETRSVNRREEIEITGKVVNNDSERVFGINTAISMYDRRGQIYECGFGIVIPSTLEPGEIASFRSLSFVQDSEVFRYDVQADGIILPDF